MSSLMRWVAMMHSVAERSGREPSGGQRCAKKKPSRALGRVRRKDVGTRSLTGRQRTRPGSAYSQSCFFLLLCFLLVVFVLILPVEVLVVFLPLLVLVFVLDLLPLLVLEILFVLFFFSSSSNSSSSKSSSSSNSSSSSSSSSRRRPRRGRPLLPPRSSSSSLQRGDSTATTPNGLFSSSSEGNTGWKVAVTSDSSSFSRSSPADASCGKGPWESTSNFGWPPEPPRNSAARGRWSRLLNPNNCKNCLVVPYRYGRPNSSLRP